MFHQNFKHLTLKCPSSRAVSALCLYPVVYKQSTGSPARSVDRAVRFISVMNAKALSVMPLMRYQDDINTEHNMKSVFRAAVAQWTKRLTRKGPTRVHIREAHIFNIT